ncbi:MAG TPA: hypothetical protein VN831_28770, partial [Bradyrhizobium sp.]|nr:hypothetical protein [Bradyrhizobium sp.]
NLTPASGRQDHTILPSAESISGAEWMFARNRSAKVEYFYLYLGNVSAIGRSASFPSTPAAYTWKIQENIVRAGVNYHF